MSDDYAWFAGGGDVGDGSELEAEAADVDGGGALGLAEEVGYGDLLGTEAFGDSDWPLAADGEAGCRGLGEDAAGWGVGGVEAIFEAENETEGAGLLAGFGEGEVGEVGNFDLAAVDGEAHGDEGGDERDGEHGQGAQNDVEEAGDASGDFSGDSELHALFEYIFVLPDASCAVLPDGAHYAWGGHFVTCVPFLGGLSALGLPLVGLRFLFPSIARARVADLPRLGICVPK